MKKILSLLLAAMLCAALAACGAGADEPSGSIADIGSGGAEQSAGQAAQSQAAAGDAAASNPAPVEIKSDRVVSTSDDGFGNLIVTEYIYKDDVLDNVIMTAKCPDAASAKELLDSYTTGDLKEYGAQLFSDMRQDGKDVILTYNDSQADVFRNYSMEQLAVMLEGGDPYQSGGDAAADGGEAKPGTSWEDMTLPEGFPKLADGVSNYSNMDTLVNLSWSTMSQGEAEAMIGKLESWAGASAEKTEMDGVIGWHMDNGKYIIDLSYYSDTFGGAMDQVMLSIMTFE